MAFKDYNQFPPPKPLKIPINGKAYSFPGAISARAWMLMHKMIAHMERVAIAKAQGRQIDPDEDVLDDLEYADIRGELFGEAEKELLDDGVTSDAMTLLFQTLVAYHSAGREAAETIWNSGNPTNGPNRATRRSQTKKTTKTTPPTRAQASGDGKPTKPAAENEAPAGATSSTNGS